MTDQEGGSEPVRVWAVIADWRFIASVIGIAALGALNLLAVTIMLGSTQVGVAPDYQQYLAAVHRFVSGEPLYSDQSLWRYSPAAILLLAPIVVWGLGPWTLLHVLSIATVRPWWLAGVMALSWPFVVDTIAGNTVTFVAVAGIHAIRGSSGGTVAYWWLTLLMPRPFQLPLAVYLAWRRRDLWRYLVLVAVMHLAIVAIVGQGPEWIHYLLDRGSEDIGQVFNIHPAASLGLYWLLLGAPLAILLAWRGLPGMAGIVFFPSLLAQYLLLGFVDVAGRTARPEARTCTGGQPGGAPPVIHAAARSDASE